MEETTRWQGCVERRGGGVAWNVGRRHGAKITRGRGEVDRDL